VTRRLDSLWFAIAVLAIWALAGARIASKRFRWEPQAARA